MDVCPKVDIEGHELDALPDWIDSGALEKVFSRSSLPHFSSFLYLLGGPDGFWASPGENTQTKEVRLRWRPLFTQDGTDRHWITWKYSEELQRLSMTLKIYFQLYASFRGSWCSTLRSIKLLCSMQCEFYRFQWLLKLLQQLYTMGFRLISHEVNSAVGHLVHLGMFEKKIEWETDWLEFWWFCGWYTSLFIDG